MSDKLHYSLVFDFFPKDTFQIPVIDLIKASFDVTFYCPIELIATM